MLDPKDIKQVFFYCDNKDPEGFYANDVDILEFGQKVAAFALAQRKPMSDEDVVDFMLTVKTDENGPNLFDRVKTIVRAVEKFHEIK
jgi:hypothetical protein